MELSLLILLYIHKSYIVYLEIYVMPIGHGFSFFCHGKVMEINVEKRGHPVCVSVVFSPNFWGSPVFMPTPFNAKRPNLAW